VFSFSVPPPCPPFFFCSSCPGAAFFSSPLALVFLLSVFTLSFSVFCFLTSLPSAFSVIVPSPSSLCSRFLLLALSEAFSTLSSLCPLDNLVARPLDMHGRVVGRGVLLDDVAVLRFDGYVAVVFGIGYFTGAAPVP
jgi:hypothetical protein